VTLLTRAERAADHGGVLDTTVAGILRHAAAAAPERVALVSGVADPTGRRRWTYAELCAEAELVAGALAARFSPGERVAAWGPSLPESLILSYALAMAGLVLVPANPAWREAEVAHVLRRSQAAGVFLAPEHRGVDLIAILEAVRPELPHLRHVAHFDDWPDLLEEARDHAMGPDHTAGGPGERAVGPGECAVGPDPDDVAQLVFTSGTTGPPKGARLTHRGLTNAARFGAERFGIGPRDVYVDTMPLFHVGGQLVAFQICQSLATNVLLESFDPGLVLELVEGERATLTVGVPTMLLALIEHPDFEGRDLSSLRAVSSGGSVVPADLVRTIERCLGVRVTVVFGQTEACGFISQTAIDDDAEDKATTLGWPLPGVSARVVDVKAGEVVAVGQVGELHVRGYNVMAGYHDDGGEDEARHPSAEPDPVSPDGWLRTGDLVTMDDRGYLRIVGRVTDMIIRGGENLYPVEIEAVVRSHPDVADVAVVGNPDARWGEVPVAFVRPQPGTAPTGPDLEAWTRARLAGFKVPRRWELLDELPLTASGKVQKFVLTARLGAATGGDGGREDRR
jgi:fatty-acyl-CoA synthase